MGLNRVDRERISDSQLKLRAVAKSLQQVDPEKVPNVEAIEECLDEAEKSLGWALRENSAKQ